MANISVSAFNKQGEAEAPVQLSGLVFVDVDSGLIQGHLTNQSLAVADATAAGVVVANNGLEYIGYIPSRGAIYARGTAGTVVVYCLLLGDDELTLPAPTFQRLLIPDGYTYWLGVDDLGVYVANNINSPTAIYRYGWDGSVSTVNLGGFYLTRGGTCPALWKGANGYRAFIQAGTGFSSAQRGATLEFDFVPGSTVSTAMDTSRYTTTAGANRGPEFCGFFYGYQPLNSGGVSAFVSPLSGALPGIKYSGTGPEGGTMTMVGIGDTTAQRVDYTSAQNGTSYYVENLVIGDALDMSDVIATMGAPSSGGTSGYVGNMPPYSGPAEAFWTDIVYALEII